MSFLNRNALLIIVVMFSLLLVIHTAFLVSHLVNAQEANSAIVATDNVVEDTASNTALTVITVLQGMLVASALTLVFFGTKSFLRLRGRLTSIANTLQNCNSAYIYNDLNQSTSADAAEFEQQKLSANLKKVREFVQAVSHGNYSITWEGIDERTLHANKDTIAGELLNMRDKMQNVKDEDQIRLWTTEGVSKFGEIIRKHQNNIDQLAENLISNIVTYVGAKVGGLFIVDETEGGQITLQLRASYAYERKKFISKSVEAGEGIVGQCFLEGQTVYMEKIPQNYMAITSGLGGAVPSSLLVIPLRANEKIEGVLELAFDAGGDVDRGCAGEADGLGDVERREPARQHEIGFFGRPHRAVASGVGNGSTYRMVPAIFCHQAASEPGSGRDSGIAIAPGRNTQAMAGLIGDMFGDDVAKSFGRVEAVRDVSLTVEDRQLVVFVVAADQGWQAQSSEHLAAVRALGITDGLVRISVGIEDLEDLKREVDTLYNEKGNGGVAT